MPSIDDLLDDFPPVPTEAWWTQIRTDLGDDARERLTWASVDGLTLAPFYREEDRPNDEAPTPGVQAGWRVQQRVERADPAQANEAARMALSGGASDLAVVMPEAPGAAPGVRLHALADARRLFEDIDLSAVPIHLDAGAFAPVALAMLLEVADEQDVAKDQLTGSTAFDPVALTLCGARSENLLDAAHELAALAGELPGMRLLAADGRPYHEAGASAVQELAYTIAAVSETLARLTARGHKADAVAQTLHLVVPVGTSFFVEVAKLRALRRLTRQVLEAYGADGGVRVPLHAVSSRRTATRTAVPVNMLRGTSAALAAVVGGCDVLGLHRHDALATAPEAFGERMARNVQLILREEVHADRVADPAAGAYYVEEATDRLGQAAWALFQETEAAGGLPEALRRGFVHEAIGAVREERARRVATRRHVLVGTTHYPAPDDEHGDDSLRDDIVAPARPVAADAIEVLRERLRSGEDFSSPDEHSSTDEHPPEGDVAPLPAVRLARPFEAIRHRTEAHVAEGGATPRVLLALLGPARTSSARATFARNVLGCAGFALRDERFETAGAAAVAAIEEADDLVVLCSTDDAYTDLVSELQRDLEARDDAPLVLVAGQPPEAEALRMAGVHTFLHRGMDVPQALAAIQDALGLSPDDTSPLPASSDDAS